MDGIEPQAFLYAFDLLELDGADVRRGAHRGSTIALALWANPSKKELGAFAATAAVSELC